MAMNERRGGMRHRRPRLTRSADFDRVYRRGRSAATRSFVLYAFPSAAVDEEDRRTLSRRYALGVSVGRKVGGAVDRNRVKRVLREAFWALDEQLPEGHDFVIVARAGAADMADAGDGRGPRRVGGAARPTREPAGGARGLRWRPRRQRRALTAPIRFYQRVISPALPRRCKYEPTLLGLRGRGDPDLRPAARRSCWPCGGCCAATPSATAGTTPSARSGCSDDHLVIADILQPLVDAADWLITSLHDDVGLSWGWSIVGLTVIVRSLMIPLTMKQIRSMNALRVLQPQIKEIQAKYKDDKQRQQQEMMKFYKENKVNPFASCLPLLLQLPVFLALFYLLKGERVQGRRCAPRGEQAFLFITDITEPATGADAGGADGAVHRLADGVDAGDVGDGRQDAAAHHAAAAVGRSRRWSRTSRRACSSTGSRRTSGPSGSRWSCAGSSPTARRSRSEARNLRQPLSTAAAEVRRRVSPADAHHRLLPARRSAGGAEARTWLTTRTNCARGRPRPRGRAWALRSGRR